MTLKTEAPPVCVLLTPALGQGVTKHEERQMPLTHTARRRAPARPPWERPGTGPACQAAPCGPPTVTTPLGARCAPTCAPSRLPAQRSALLLPCTPGFTPLRSPKTARPTPHPDVPATSVSKAKAGQGRPRASPRHQVTPPRPITRPTCTACPSDTQRPGVWSSTRDRAAPRLSPSG